MWSRQVLFALMTMTVLPSWAHAADRIKGATCQAPSSEQRLQAASYLAKRAHSSAGQQPILLDSSLANPSCFWKLTYDLGDHAHPVTVFLSPDRKYITTDLLDLAQDPLKEEREKGAALNVMLASGAVPSKGRQEAKVTLVEFSDFQCPYCKRLTDTLEKDIEGRPDLDVRIAFREFPLPMHPWAKQAAEAAECAAMQKNEFFWRFHDYFFANQQTFTAENVREKANAFASTIPNFDVPAFGSCIDQELSLGPVQHDIALGQKQGVHATPTMFINGIRVEGVRSSVDLLRLIKSAAEGSLVDALPGPSRTVPQPQGGQACAPRNAM